MDGGNDDHEIEVKPIYRILSSLFRLSEYFFKSYLRIFSKLSRFSVGAFIVYIVFIRPTNLSVNLSHVENLTDNLAASDIR